MTTIIIAIVAFIGGMAFERKVLPVIYKDEIEAEKKHLI